MANTGYTLPQTASNLSETGWDDSGGAWQTPQAIYGPGSASITNDAFDNGNPSHVLRGFNFNFSAVPDTATIDGVMVRIYSKATSTNSSLGLVQLLDTSLARVGTNSGSSAVKVTTSSAPYVFGASNNLWGNALTPTWVKNSNFGVGVGMINGANNADVYIDSVEMDVYYTEAVAAKTKVIRIVNNVFTM